MSVENHINEKFITKTRKLKFNTFNLMQIWKKHKNENLKCGSACQTVVDHVENRSLYQTAIYREILIKLK